MKEFLTNQDSAMPEFICIIIVLGFLTACGFVIIRYRAKQAHFEIWIHEFEMILGSKTDVEDEMLLRDLFTKDVSIREAVAIYNDVKSDIC